MNKANTKGNEWSLAKIACKCLMSLGLKWNKISLVSLAGKLLELRNANATLNWNFQYYVVLLRKREISFSSEKHIIHRPNSHAHTRTRRKNFCKSAMKTTQSTKFPFSFLRHHSRTHFPFTTFLTRISTAIFVFSFFHFFAPSTRFDFSSSPGKSLAKKNFHENFFIRLLCTFVN